jgi:hypothetical protein
MRAWGKSLPYFRVGNAARCIIGCHAAMLTTIPVALPYKNFKIFAVNIRVQIRLNTCTWAGIFFIIFYCQAL